MDPHLVKGFRLLRVDGIGVCYSGWHSPCAEMDADGDDCIGDGHSDGNNDDQHGTEKQVAHEE